MAMENVIAFWTRVEADKALRNRLKTALAAADLSQRRSVLYEVWAVARGEGFRFTPDELEVVLHQSADPAPKNSDADDEGIELSDAQIEALLDSEAEVAGHAYDRAEIQPAMIHASAFGTDLLKDTLAKPGGGFAGKK